jgi:hypothetical protein
MSSNWAHAPGAWAGRASLEASHANSSARCIQTKAAQDVDTAAAQPRDPSTRAVASASVLNASIYTSMRPHNCGQRGAPTGAPPSTLAGNNQPRSRWGATPRMTSKTDIEDIGGWDAKAPAHNKCIAAHEHCGRSMGVTHARVRQWSARRQCYAGLHSFQPLR